MSIAMSKKFIQDLACRKVDCLHSAEMAHSLYQQWLNGEYCDFKIMVEDRCYKVHKCVIACFSAKFGEETEKLEMIKLVGVTKFGFEKILEFMYKGKMTKLASIDLPKFQEIMKAADVLNSSKVVRYCTQERNDLVLMLRRNCSFDIERSHCLGGSYYHTSIAMKEPCSHGQADNEQDMIADGCSEDEDPLRGSTTSLVECLAAEGEIGMDLTTAVNKTLSADDLAKLMDISTQPLDATSSNAIQECDRSKRISIFDGWQKKFQCSICSKGFMSDALLQHHMEKHNDDQYSCHLCGNKYRFEIALLSHLKEHKQNRVVCELCDKSFKFNSSLKIHMEKSHPEAVAGSLTVFKKPVGNVAPVAKVQDDPQIDVSLLTDMLNQMKPDADGKFLCPLCDRDFSRKWNLRYHILKHAEDRAFWPRFDPKSGQMLHQCHECNATFQKDTGLKRHISIMHRDSYASTTKPLALLSGKQKQNKKGELEICCWCDICGKGFKRQRNLDGHMETHNGSGFQCPICGRVFPQKNGLHGHLWVHGGYNGASDAARKGGRRSCPPMSNHIPIESEVIEVPSHCQDERNTSLDLTSHEEMPEDLSEDDEKVTND